MVKYRNNLYLLAYKGSMTNKKTRYFLRFFWPFLVKDHALRLEVLLDLKQIIEHRGDEEGEEQ